MIYEDDPELPRWAQLITRVLISGRGKQKNENQRDNSRRRTQPKVAGFEDGGIRPQIKEHGQPLEAGKGKETDSLLAFPEETQH